VEKHESKVDVQNNQTGDFVCNKFYRLGINMNTDEKNDKLKFYIKEIATLITQLEHGKLISQENRENLLMLKKGIDGLIRDGLLHIDPKDSVQKINSAATPTDTSAPESDDPSDSEKYFDKYFADPPTDTSAPESVDWKISKSHKPRWSKPSQDVLAVVDELQRIQDENAPEPELDEDGNIIHWMPKNLVAARGKEPAQIEKELLVSTHNALVIFRLREKESTKNKRRRNKNGHQISAQKYKQVKESDKVRDYWELEDRYKHARSFSSYKSYLRKVSWHALQMGDGGYDSVSWYENVYMYPELQDIVGVDGDGEYADIMEITLDDRLDQIGKSSGKDRPRKPKDATNLEKKMIVEDA
jgi:hypothetical protein